MKKAGMLVSLVFIAAQYCFSQFSSDKLAVMQVLIQQQSAWNKGSIEGFMDGYWKSDSLQFIGKKGITKGWQNTLDVYKKSYPDTGTMGKLNFEIISIDVLSGQSAFVIGKWLLSRQKGDIGGYFSIVLKKINGHWLIVSDHSS